MKKYKTVIISDVHLGIEDSKSKELLDFLKSIKFEILIINGDFIDGWALQRGSKWKKKHTAVIRYILKLTEKKNVRVIYIRGNHDDFLNNILPLTFGKIEVYNDFVYESNGKKYYITHGDIFDTITKNLKWLAVVGSIGYDFLLWINRIYNRIRAKLGKPYFSLSQKIKDNVKLAVSYISDFEESIAKLAIKKGYDGVICGHIHTPSIVVKNEYTYMNSGDWVENASALVEDFDGKWKIHKEKIK